MYTIDVTQSHHLSSRYYNITVEERGTGISNYCAVLHVYMYVRC